jgi:ubiquitin-protein ligase E3 C
MNDMVAYCGSVQSYNRFLNMGQLGFPNGKERVQVRRGNVSQDGFDRLGEVDLKAPIEIAFIDQFWQEECVSSLFPSFFLFCFLICVLL